jgi:hypothetical protein
MRTNYWRRSARRATEKFRRKRETDFGQLVVTRCRRYNEKRPTSLGSYAVPKTEFPFADVEAGSLIEPERGFIASGDRQLEIAHLADRQLFDGLADKSPAQSSAVIRREQADGADLAGRVVKIGSFWTVAVEVAKPDSKLSKHWSPSTRTPAVRLRKL